MISIQNICNIYEKASVFLICNGPSFNSVDKQLLDKKGIVTFGVNDSARTYKPDMWCCVDDPLNFCRDIFIDDSILKFMNIDYCKNHTSNVSFIQNASFNADTFLDGFDINYGNSESNGGGRSVLLAALKILYILGFRTVYLLGVDFHMSESTENYHFNQHTSKLHVKRNNESYSKISRYLDELKPIFDRHSFSVFNCNKKSMLKTFDYIEFEEAIKKASIIDMPKRYLKNTPKHGSDDLLKIICVLKTGGDFSADDVNNLKLNLKKYINTDYDFICYSDVEEVSDEPLTFGLKGWWSKLEIFKEVGKCIYFDLDVSIMSNIDNLIKWVSENANKIAMVEDWTPSWRENTWNSTIIAWNGDFSYIIDCFEENIHTRDYRGDQEYISGVLKSKNVDVALVNEIQKGCYSYKKTCLGKVLPNDSSVICFHGKPRPKEVGMPFWGHHLSNNAIKTIDNNTL